MHSRAAVLAYAILACLLPAVVLLSLSGTDSARALAVGVVAAAMLCVLVAVTGHRRVPILVAVAGPPDSALRRLRGAFLPQSNPDSAGRPRPRAPGTAHC